MRPTGHLLRFTTDFRGDLLDTDSAAVDPSRFQQATRPRHLLEFPHHMPRQADQARLVQQRVFHALASPPRRLGAETEAAAGIELGDGVHQFQIALFDEVNQRQATAQVVLDDADDGSQIAFDHALAGQQVVSAGTAGGGESS